MRVLWAARTHPGLRRPINEDSYCARPDVGLFLVADGMGGHAGGEVASRLAAETIEQFIVESVGWPADGTWPFPYDRSLTPQANRLKSAFRLANRRLGEESGKQPALRGMATTASVVLVTAGRTVTVAHVGDSRVYSWRGGTLSRRTRDHSWVEDQVRAGILDANAARQHPWRNVVTRALAGGDDLEVDLFDVAVEEGDRLLLCSDGLYGAVGERTVERALTEESGLEALCDRLVAAANAAGGPDNITVVALECHVA
jgi:protein phosphatase